MAALKKAANGYDYMEPMLESEWDVLPEPKQRRRRAVKERVEIVYEVHPEQVAKRRRAVSNCPDDFDLFRHAFPGHCGKCGDFQNKLGKY